MDSTYASVRGLRCACISARRRRAGGRDIAGHRRCLGGRVEALSNNLAAGRSQQQRQVLREAHDEI